MSFVRPCKKREKVTTTASNPIFGEAIPPKNHTDGMSVLRCFTPFLRVVPKGGFSCFNVKRVYKINNMPLKGDRNPKTRETCENSYSYILHIYLICILPLSLLYWDYGIIIII